MPESTTHDVSSCFHREGNVHRHHRQNCGTVDLEREALDPEERDCRGAEASK